MNSRQKSLIIGAVVGATLGAVGGYLFSRGIEMSREKGSSLSLRSVPAGDIVKLLIAVMGVLRGIAELGERL